MINKIKFAWIVMAGIFMFFAFSFGIDLAFAASFSIGSSDSVKIGQVFETKIFLNTDGKFLNTLGGTLSFNSDVLEVKDISYGGSIVNVWIDVPKVGVSGKIPFSGMMIGGQNKNKGYIFSATFKAKKSGDGNLQIKNAVVFIDDGSGTALTVKDYTLKIPVKKADLKDNTTQAQNAEPVATKDSTPPYSFEPVVTKIKEIAGDKYVLLFSTRDSQSGVDHYEVKEGDGSFKTAESPYVLEDQTLKDKITIKAVDKDSNSVEVILPRDAGVSSKYINLVLIVVFGLFALLFIRKLHKKRFI